MSYPRKWLTGSIAGGVALGLVVGFSVKATSGGDDNKTNVDTGTTVVAPETSAANGDTTVTVPASGADTSRDDGDDRAAGRVHDPRACAASGSDHCGRAAPHAAATPSDDHCAAAAASASEALDHAVRDAAADPDRLCSSSPSSASLPPAPARSAPSA